MAHQATLVMQLRGLDTGVAVDVSGVLRISRGGSAGDALRGNGKEDHQWEENEYLYFVQGDGGVKVFGRGE
jgi:elongator complex protein 6